MTKDQLCPKCSSEHCYSDGNLWICAICAHEWNPGSVGQDSDANQIEQVNVCDANGQVLKDGDSVTVIKDLKVKGSSSVIKVGTKVKNVRVLMDANDGHNLACRVDGVGAINLKSEFVRKS